VIRTRKGRVGFGAASVLAAALLMMGPSAAAATAAARFTIFPFPSANSTVVASVGFLNSCEVGYFWSVSRGDSVTETFNGPASITRAKLRATVVQNVLNSGAHVSWRLSINGTDVASFKVPEGEIGTLKLSATFAAISGPSYTVKIRVTNEVASGQGSITLAYACSYPHGVALG